MRNPPALLVDPVERAGRQPRHTAHADSRLRPLARRRRRTFRPPGVFMRLLNPCLRFRFKTCGLNVGFMPYLLYECSAARNKHLYKMAGLPCAQRPGPQNSEHRDPSPAGNENAGKDTRPDATAGPGPTSRPRVDSDPARME